MKSFFTACAVCGSLDARPLFPSFFRGQVNPAQMIVICRQCGLVYRNPHIPDVCVKHYEEVGSWEGEEVYIERLRAVAERIASHVRLASDDLYLEIGSGPGWLAEHMRRMYPAAGAVLLEPSPKVAAYAQNRNPQAAVLPAMLDEAHLPKAAFSCVIACGVDYLFQHHRKDIERIHGLLKDGGTFYIERNVFLGQQALTKRPLFDAEDLFGLNHRINTWFGREQFREYLEQFFEIYDTFEYVSDASPPPYARKNVVTGLFGRKRPAGEQRTAGIRNRYDEHMALLRGMAVESSLDDLRILANEGVRRVAVLGSGEGAMVLTGLIREHDLFAIVDVLEDADAIFVASVGEQEQVASALEANGYRNVLRCFRVGLPSLWNEGRTIQMKALLPAYLRAA